MVMVTLDKPPLNAMPALSAKTKYYYRERIRSILVRREGRRHDTYFPLRNALQINSSSARGLLSTYVLTISPMDEGYYRRDSLLYER
jgi:hypothetical protein